MVKDKITLEQIMGLLDSCYTATLNGLPNTPSAEDLAHQYLEKYKEPQKAIYKLVNAQIMKCSTSGFITGLGGIITLPVAIPANVGSVIYVQVRMIAAIAVIGGYNPHDDKVQTLVYMCLAGMSVGDLFKQAGVQFGNKFTTAMIKKIPGTVLTKINQKVGFRFITKFGEKGLINLGKMVPAVGGIIGAGVDYAGTRKIAKSAYKTFILNIT